VTFRCAYCKADLGAKPTGRCPACGRLMIVPDRLRVVEIRRRRKVKEQIRHDAEWKLRSMRTLDASLIRRPVVVFAALVLLAMAGGGLWRQAGQTYQPSRRRTPLLAADEELLALRIALERFRRDAGRYPTVEEGLLALIRNPGVSTWEGPYVNLIRPDPWRERYVYRPDTNGVTLFSCGPDRTPCTADDLVAGPPEAADPPP
jgi:hypothetical protein